jgi:uncharacterized protein
MKLQPDQFIGVNAVQSFRGGRVTINGVEWRTSLVMPWQGAVTPWTATLSAGSSGEAGVDLPAATFEGLTAAHFERLLACDPELVIFGSGERLRFVAPALLASLIKRRIGIETMDTAAACRTYNILVGEGRKAVAALIV